MSKGKDGMTAERWEHIKKLSLRDKWVWVSKRLIRNPLGKLLPPLVERERGKTFNQGRNKAKRLKRHMQKVKG